MAREGLTPVNLQTSDVDYRRTVLSVIHAFQAKGAPLGEMYGHTFISDRMRLDVLWNAVGEVKQQMAAVEGIERMTDQQVGVFRRIAAHQVTEKILTDLRNNSSH